MGGAPLEVRNASTELDVEGVRAGVDLRLGSAASNWTVDVTDTEPTEVLLVLTSPSGESFSRRVALEGEDPAARARQLSATVALMIEHLAAEAEAEAGEVAAPATVQGTVHPKPVGWAAIGARLGSNFTGEPGFEGGVGLAGGGWLVHEHVQPFGGVTWTRSAAGGLVVHGLRISGGMAAGASLAQGRLWIGGALQASALAAIARDRSQSTAWSAALSPQGVVQVRIGRWMLGVHLGPEWLLPPLRFVGAERSLRWRTLRFSLDFRLGAVFRR